MDTWDGTASMIFMSSGLPSEGRLHTCFECSASCRRNARSFALIAMMPLEDCSNFILIWEIVEFKYFGCLAKNANLGLSDRVYGELE